MKFVNRTNEIKELENIYTLSHKKLFPVLITGDRRIGKTRLLKEFSKKNKRLYFFVHESKTQKSLLEEFTQELKRNKAIDKYTKLQTLEEFIDYLFEKIEGYIIIFDEVQYLRFIYPSFFSYFQMKIDENEDSKNMILFCGSIIGLLKEIFENNKSPLYGRIKSHIYIKPLSFKDAGKMLEFLGYKRIEEKIQFYSIFGGYPKYYVALEDYNIKSDIHSAINQLFLRENAPLKDEVRNILIQEFGKGKRNYYSILEAIAGGNTKLIEIANKVGKHQTEITPYMDELLNWYEVIGRDTPITESKNSKKSTYFIKSPLIKFWFHYIYPNLRYMELGQFDEIKQKIRKNINYMISKRFEEISKETISLIYSKKYPLIGRWWGHKRTDNKREEMEIDIVAINEDRKEILFAECKWKNKINAEQVLKELKEKARYVKWNNNKRKEKYVIFAKSFRNKKLKDAELIDLKDMEKLFKN